jgi:hypothetical protein
MGSEKKRVRERKIPRQVNSTIDQISHQQQPISPADLHASMSTRSRLFILVDRLRLEGLNRPLGFV